MSNPRRQIPQDFAKWTALSALRSGAPLKSRQDVYPLIDAINFAAVVGSDRVIDRRAFDAWHRRETEAIVERDNRLVVGWAAKVINVYLKTAVYVGDLGRPGLREVLHPPLDGGLWAGLRRQFVADPALLAEICCVERIRDIDDYDTYLRIIKGCRRAAVKAGCTLCELEQYWRGPVTKSKLTTGREGSKKRLGQ